MPQSKKSAVKAGKQGPVKKGDRLNGREPRPPRAASTGDTRTAGRRTSGTVPSKETLVRAFTLMYTARKTDDKILILLKQGKIFFHIGASGHEAAQVGTALAMKPGYDWAYPYYRDLGFSLGFGYTVEEIFREAMHRAAGPSSAGFAMPFHYGHKQHRIVSQSSVACR